MSDAVLRVLSYNIRSLRDDRGAVVRVIRAAAPDVVCIQEAPRFLFWRRACAWLAESAGLVIAAGGRDAAANLVLARPDLPVADAHSVLFTKDPRLHQRGMAMARIAFGGGDVVVAGTHLDGYPEPRLRHIAELRRALAEFAADTRSVLLAGDMNADPGSAEWAELESLGVDAFAVAGTGDGNTLNVRTPTRRIDGIFAGGALTVRSATAIDSTDVRVASDHRPVFAEIAVTPRRR